MPITKLALENLGVLGIRKERLEVLENLLQRFMKEDVRQAILIKVVKKGIPIFEGTYGRSSRDYGLKMDTIFQVCSISKPVIGTLLFMLQEDGLVDLADPVYKYLPEFNQGGREKICLWHFLTHTSGLMDDEIWNETKKYVVDELGMHEFKEDFTNEEVNAYFSEVREKLGILPESKGRMADVEYVISLRLPIKKEPRSHMTYFNYGFQRLKDVIEVASGESIDQYAKRKLFDPLGMQNTAWKLPKDLWHKVIGRFDEALASKWFNSDKNNENESGSGGMKTTIDDILKYQQMILNGGVYDGVRYLSKASLKLLSINHNQGVESNGSEEFSTWALAWNLKGNKKDDAGMLRSSTSIEHGGYAGTKILVDPEYDLAIACFSVEYERLVDEKYVGIMGKINNVIYAAFE